MSGDGGVMANCLVCRGKRGVCPTCQGRRDGRVGRKGSLWLYDCPTCKRLKVCPGCKGTGKVK
ncbi:hypothetical protein [Pseudonocardia sp. WMMC193]|uniref:hypothetical protein n=1 Tax=Pseudonocardia sp. WMMC193 TaxID=2911965 RepID=UPI001F46BFC8|nr:hypothetical protein [Pseudonocardia sp. WMMC193]MCF7549044.1 hypothetical protein [Pseudonocardia sp. WMMC193]